MCWPTIRTEDPLKRWLFAAGFAAAIAPGAAQAHLTHHEAVAYGRAYGHVVHVLGHRAAGCKLIGPKASCRHTTDQMVRRSTQTLHRMLAPAPTPAAPAPAASASAATTAQNTTSYSGGYSIPSYIVQCESGGNWSAVNPTSGAGGAYQVMPQSWAAYGGLKYAPDAQDATPAEQSIIAARIYADVGPSAWTCG